MTSLATLSFAALGLHLVVTGTVLTVTGEISAYYPLLGQVVFWTGLGLAWLGVARALVAWSRRRGVDPLPSDAGGALGHRTWTWILVCFVCALLASVVVPVLGPDPWLIAPLRVYLDLYDLHGPIAWLPLIAWVIHHVGRAVLAASVVAYAHRAVLLGPITGSLCRLPWGGLIAGVCFGAVGHLVAGAAVALATLSSLVLLGLIHVLSRESLWITAGFAVLVLIFL